MVGHNAVVVPAWGPATLCSVLLCKGPNLHSIALQKWSRDDTCYKVYINVFVDESPEQTAPYNAVVPGARGHAIIYVEKNGEMIDCDTFATVDQLVRVAEENREYALARTRRELCRAITLGVPLSTREEQAELRLVGRDIPNPFGPRLPDRRCRERSPGRSSRNRQIRGRYKPIQRRRTEEASIDSRR